MRRAGRLLFTLSSAVSLLLFAVVVLLWVHVHRAAAAFERDHRARYAGARSVPAYNYDFAHLRLGERQLVWVGSFRCNALVLGWNTNGPMSRLGRYGWQPMIDYQGVRTQTLPRTISLGPHLGVNYRNFPGERGGPPGTVRGLVVPHWLAAMLALVLPVTWAVRTARARRQRSAGLCRTCGYDLRASPGRCPECGAAATSDATGPKEMPA
jgi:hypothetical protein